MTQICAVDFETGNLTNLITSSGATASTTAKLEGAYGMLATPGAAGFHYGVFGTPGAAFNAATVFINFLLRVQTLKSSGNMDILACDNVSAVQKAMLQLTSGGVLRLLGPSQTLIATGTTVLNTVAAHKIGLTFGTGAGSVAYELRINDVVELSGSASFGNVNAGSVALGAGIYNATPSAATLYFDNVTIDDANWPRAYPRHISMAQMGVG